VQCIMGPWSDGLGAKPPEADTIYIISTVIFALRMRMHFNKEFESKNTQINR
jgi:hypothetical protein